MRFRQKQVLLPPVAKPGAHQSAGADRIQRLHRLPRVAAGVFRFHPQRVLPYRDAVLFVSDHKNHHKHGGRAQQHQSAQIRFAGAAHIHHNQSDGQQQNGTGQVRFDKDQPAHHA